MIQFCVMRYLTIHILAYAKEKNVKINSHTKRIFIAQRVYIIVIEVEFYRLNILRIYSKRQN